MAFRPAGVTQPVHEVTPTQFAAATSRLAGHEYLRAIVPTAAPSGPYELVTMATACRS